MINLEKLLTIDNKQSMINYLSGVEYENISEILFEYLTKHRTKGILILEILKIFPQSHPIFEDYFIYLYKEVEDDAKLIMYWSNCLIEDIFIDSKRTFFGIDKDYGIFLMVLEQICYHKNTYEIQKEFVENTIKYSKDSTFTFSLLKKIIDLINNPFTKTNSIAGIISSIKDKFPKNNIIKYIVKGIDKNEKDIIFDGIVEAYPELYNIAKETYKLKGVDISNVGNPFDYLEELDLSQPDIIDVITKVILKNKKYFEDGVPLRITELLEETEVFEWISLLTLYPKILDNMNYLTMEESEYLDSYRSVPNKIMNNRIYSDAIKALEDSVRIGGNLIKEIVIEAINKFLNFRR